jgi:hypothetical protein
MLGFAEYIVFYYYFYFEIFLFLPVFFADSIEFYLEVWG